MQEMGQPAGFYGGGYTKNKPQTDLSKGGFYDHGGSHDNSFLGDAWGAVKGAVEDLSRRAYEHKGVNKNLPSFKDIKEGIEGLVGWETGRPITIPPRGEEPVENFEEPTQFDTSGTMSPEVSQGATKGFIDPHADYIDPDSNTHFITEEYINHHNPVEGGSSPERKARYLELFENANINDVEPFARTFITKMAKQFGLDPEMWLKFSVIESSGGVNLKGDGDYGALQARHRVVKAIANEKHERKKFIEIFNSHIGDYGITAEEILDEAENNPKEFKDRMMQDAGANAAVVMTMYFMKKGYGPLR
jgi:hypothetical protein